MWKRVQQWYLDLRAEQMAVLLEPSVAANVQGYFRACSARNLAKLSAIERSQLHAFASTYQGRTLWIAVFKLCALFCLLGLALYWWKPKGGVILPLIVAQFFGWAIVFTLIGIWFNYRQFVRAPSWSGVSRLLGLYIAMLIGFTVTSWLTGNDPVQAFIEKGVVFLKALALCGSVYVVMVGIVSIWRNKTYEIMTIQLALDAERERNARQETESQLRMLRAQIEPHFLFNTLGAVQTLAEQGGATKAAELAANLIVFLRACMQEIRAERISLREEYAMLGAYLEVMKVRMGQRLHFHLDLPNELAETMVPSMMLLSLVENAIKHGLEPSLQGGELTITSRCEGNEIRICVADTGVGLSDKPGSGIGLANVRERLRLAYGAQSRLTIYEQEQGGVMAEIVLQRTKQGLDNDLKNSN